MLFSSKAGEWAYDELCTAILMFDLFIGNADHWGQGGDQTQRRDAIFG